ncbi:hypothetical protein FHU10_3375 [Serratia fonticola]|uniref:Uncharacterized protein n=1 Tax=Serratia fonticola TaxID=47917 RepID=A0A542BSY5_SERFO|nr:hypothetical protein FHU09_4334 [Serratia fonticola]TQI96283.1 hypothetical protein FHU11_1714 [Serratia fonticola]TVZ70781.1 hypothetical protein FHU10_3375 [Serratia fonticola]
MTLTAHAEESRLYIRSLFDIEYAFCAIKTNGVLGMDNRNSARQGRGFGTSSTAAMLFLENGENEVSLELGALGWFDKKDTSVLERALFNPQASCKLELTAMRGSNSEVLSAIEVGIGKDGLPEAKIPADEQKFKTISGPVVRQKILAEQVVRGHKDNEYFNPYKYPSKMEIYRFSRQVQVSGLPEWSWVKATPYTDTPEQRKGLEQAYIKIWRTMDNKDLTTLRKQLKLSLAAWAWSTGEGEESIFVDRGMKSDIQNSQFKMIPINWQDYDVQIMNKGRLVRLINKSDPSVSPLSYYCDSDGDTVMRYISPIFSLINGEFVLVI